MSKETKEKEQDTFNDIVAAIDALESEPTRHLSIQIDNSVRDAVVAAQNSGQPAAVTITLKVKPGPERRVGFTATVNAKLPRPPVSGVMLYADDAGKVHKSDPAQLKMSFPPPVSIAPKKEA